MPRPDVALISPYPAPDTRHGGRSGVASYARALAHALHDDGAQVTVIAPADEGVNGDAMDGGVQVKRPFTRGPGALVRAARAARATGAPTVHLQHETFLYGGASSVPALMPALRSMGGRRGGAVVTMHHVVDTRTVDRAFTRVHRVGAPAPIARAALLTVQRTIRRLASAVVVHEPGFARVIPEAHVVPHGIEHRAGSPVSPMSRSSLGAGGDDLVVLCFGFLAPYKGLEAALAGARLAGAGIRLVVAGGEHPRLAAAGDGYAAGLRERYGDIVTFTGYVGDEDVDAMFAAADVALFPYPRPFATSGPLALALGHGTPFLLSDALARCADAPPITGVAPEPSAIAGRLRSLADDPAARERLADACAQVAGDRTWASVARRHRDIYAQVAA